MRLEFITQKEAETIKRKMPKSKTMLEFEGYLNQLQDGQVGKIVVTPKDNVKPQTVRSRLNRAGKSLGLNIQSKRVANTILFWKG